MGVATRTRNVSEYMLVLALCLVIKIYGPVLQCIYVYFVFSCIASVHSRTVSVVVIITLTRMMTVTV